MSSRPLFTAFGIPVTFDPFFIFGAFLFYSWAGGGQRGMYTVVAMVVFVVIHEFGHALTAKAFGARAEITVTFLGGYASYAPSRRQTTRHRVLISLMGPLTQLAVAVPALWIVANRATNATSAEELRSTYDLIDAIGWAGVFLAFLNLVPLWPLDGGHIVESLLQRVAGERSRRPFLIGSVVASVMLGVLAVLIETDVIAPLFGGLQPPATESFGLRMVLFQLWQMPTNILGGALFLPLITGLGSASELGRINRARAHIHADDAPTRRELAREEVLRATRQAERSSWSSGFLAEYPSGWGPSPWVRAHVDLLAGRTDAAIDDLADLADGRSRHWLLDRPDHPEIDLLLTMVPPVAADGLAVLEARVHHGSPEDLVALATAIFVAEQSAEPLYLGAAGLAVRGLDDEAMLWLHRAVNVAPDPGRMAVDREFHGLHRRSDFQQLLGVAQRAVVPGAAR